jgi:hypothetical protein
MNPKMGKESEEQQKHMQQLSTLKSQLEQMTK